MMRGNGTNAKVPWQVTPKVIGALVIVAVASAMSFGVAASPGGPSKPTLAPTVAAQLFVGGPPLTTPAECDPVEEFDGCNLEVFVGTYTKDGDGAFAPASEIHFGECFYVNAVVVNTGNVSTTNPVQATVDLSETDASLRSCAGNNATQTAINVCGPGEMSDFWWKVCRDAPTRAGTVVVSATDNGDPACEAVGTATIAQAPPWEGKCVTVEIIEAPGLNSPQGERVTPCTDFEVRAMITNLCSSTLNNVNGTISWTGPATLVGDDSAEKCLGDLPPEASPEVAWTLHCDDPGDVVITVGAEENACGGGGTSLHGNTTYINNPWTVYQVAPASMTVEITTPADCDEALQGDNCGLNDVPVSVTTTNTGNLTVDNILVTVIGNDTSLWSWTGLNWDVIASLAPGASHVSDFDGECEGPGGVELTAGASGTTIVGPIAAADDTVDIVQERVLALLPLNLTGAGYTYAFPGNNTNMCETFDIVGSFRNAALT
jgi:hypothetical protein